MLYKKWKWGAVKLIETLPPKAQDYIIASLLLDDFHMLPSGSEEQNIVNTEVADFLEAMYQDITRYGTDEDILEAAKLAQALFRRVAQTQRMVHLPESYLKAQAYCAALEARAQAVIAHRADEERIFRAVEKAQHEPLDSYSTSCNTADDSVSP